MNRKQERKRTESRREEKTLHGKDAGRKQEILRTDTLVIGAGASGLAAGISASRRSGVIIADGNDRTGKKLYATGNGRCNFTNAGCSEENYNGGGDGFVSCVLKQFSVQDTLEFFEECGMMSRREEGGRYYPYSGQASSVVRALTREAQRRGCRLFLGDRAVSTEKIGESDTFSVLFESGRRILCRNLIIACGGRAGLKTGSTGDGYGFARTFGHTLVPPRPALTAVESEAGFPPGLKGVRSKGCVCLYRDGRETAREQGEIQFTETGISGICVFDLTRHMEGLQPPGGSGKKRKDTAREEAEHRYEIVCDFVPEKTEEELYLLIRRRMERGYDMQSILEGIVNDRLAAVILEQSGCRAVDAAALLKAMWIPVSHTKGWNEAQVTCGGIRREEIDPRTMQSRLADGLYFCGEVVDVDGRCGGFNLQWAWSSGTVAGRLSGKQCGRMKKFG